MSVPGDHIPAWQPWAGGAFIVLLIFGIVLIPEWQVNKDLALERITEAQRPAFVNDYRKTALQFAGGLVVAFGLILTYRRIRATERANEILEEGQVTERFTRAIEQLGSNETAIRLGGIYALERIGRDSPKDHWTVVEVLSAFIRENATEFANRPSRFSESESGDWPASEASVQTDIQAALTALCRREKRGEESAIDLRGCWLRGYKFERRSDLSNCLLSDSELQGCTIINCNLSNADLCRSSLKGSNLSDSTLNGAKLKQSDMSYCDLGGAQFANAWLPESALQMVEATQAVFVDAVLNRSDLTQGVFSEADFSRARLIKADLTAANFWLAKLPESRLMGSIVMDADFTDSDLSNSSLHNTKLLEVAVINGGTNLDGARGLPPLTASVDDT